MVIVKQDATIKVADDHALAQLSHQRTKLVTLLRDLVLGLGHQTRHVGLQGPTFVGKTVQRLGQPGQRLGASSLRAGRIGIPGKQPRRISQPRRGCNMAGVKTRGKPASEHRPSKPPAKDQRAAFGQRRRKPGGHPSRRSGDRAA
ncbi:hypothetical protein ACFSS8_01155 [Paracoccus kondratievae]